MLKGISNFCFFFEILGLGKRKKSPPSWILTDIHAYISTNKGQAISYFYIRGCCGACNLIFHSQFNFDVLTNILIMFSQPICYKCSLMLFNPVVTSC